MLLLFATFDVSGLAAHKNLPFSLVAIFGVVSSPGNNFRALSFLMHAQRWMEKMGPKIFLVSFVSMELEQGFVMSQLDIFFCLCG